MYCGAVFPNTQHNTFNVLIPKYAPHALQSTVTTIKQCTYSRRSLQILQFLYYFLFTCVGNSYKRGQHCNSIPT